MEIYEKLCNIQNELKAPKSQYNSFGKYNYRNCEDILEAVKSICLKYKTTLVIRDFVVPVRDRYYVEAHATLYDWESDKSIESIASAREEESKKGMDASQVTGATSSYARKYALNALFAIDDTKDADSMQPEQPEKKKPAYVCKTTIKDIIGLGLDEATAKSAIAWAEGQTGLKLKDFDEETEQWFIKACVKKAEKLNKGE